MKYKEELLNNLSEIENLISNKDIPNKLQNQLTKVENDLKNFKIYIPLVGAFNSGKSSLINKYLGEDLLPTNIKPETAIAAEIKYGDNDKVFAHDSDGKKDKFEIEDINEISSSQYKYIEVVKNNYKLKKLTEKNIVLVDMPGLDSGIEDHNQAIFNYIKEGVYYIVLTEIDHGLQGSVINFLQELNIYDMDFSILLTKVDHKTKNDIQEIVAQTKEVSSDISGSSVYVGTTTIKDDDISDFKEVLNSIDKNKMIEKVFKEQILELINKIKRDLELRLQYQNVDTAEIDEKIKNIETQIKNLDKKIEEERRRIEREFSSNTKNTILNDVRQKLSMNTSRLVQSAKAGQDSFSRAVNEIIRPILTQSANENINLVLNKSFDNIGQEMDNIVNDVSRVPGKLSKASDYFDDIAKKTNNAAYKKIVGGLGIITDVIAPWLEVIMLFLPDIIKLFSNKEAEIKSKINNEVIPQVINKLDSEVGNSLQETKDKFINQVKKDVENQKEELIESLNNAKKEKQNKKEEFKKRKKQIEESLQRLNTIKSKL